MTFLDNFITRNNFFLMHILWSLIWWPVWSTKDHKFSRKFLFSLQQSLVLCKASIHRHHIPKVTTASFIFRRTIEPWSFHVFFRPRYRSTKIAPWLWTMRRLTAPGAPPWRQVLLKERQNCADGTVLFPNKNPVCLSPTGLDDPTILLQKRRMTILTIVRHVSLISIRPNCPRMRRNVRAWPTTAVLLIPIFTFNYTSRPYQSMTIIHHPLSNHVITISTGHGRTSRSPITLPQEDCQIRLAYLTGTPTTSPSQTIGS